MLKSLLLSGLLAFSGVVAMPYEDTEPTEPVVTEPETPVEEEPTEPAETYFIETQNNFGGSLSYKVLREKVEIESGYQAGDIVEITPEPVVFYKLNNISAIYGETTISLEHVENTTTWSFELKEQGTYVVKAEFIVDNETLQHALEIYNSAKKGDWKDVFTVSNITFFATTLLYIVYFIVKVFQDRKFRNNVISDVCSQFGLSRDSTPEQIVQSLMDKAVMPTLKSLEKSEKNNKECIQALTKAMLYMQENTPESKQEIIKMIGKLEFTDDTTKEVVEQVMAELEKQKNSELAKKLEIDNKFDELREETKTAAEPVVNEIKDTVENKSVEQIRNEIVGNGTSE